MAHASSVECRVRTGSRPAGYPGARRPHTTCSSPRPSGADRPPVHPDRPPRGRLKRRTEGVRSAATRPVRPPRGRGSARHEYAITSPDRAHTVGELVTCPFCVSVRGASTLTVGPPLWPRATRTATGALTSPAGADALQPAYGAPTGRATADE
ncbi:DUF1360 domain-containing protein [Streptomyces scabiei]|uniref:DUF1360 domain-containing protein n=1 Tax=Streptomyces scabiei TaxID=1930 RepID=UPI00099E79BC|nr:DUF1360 domain-containing protein [Streptomyces scabiei]